MTSSFDNALKIISKKYSISVEELSLLLENTFNKDILKKDIILPFNGIINSKCCKAVVYNHGLYTQCTRITINEICNKCLLPDGNIKYGRIEERAKYPIGKFKFNNKSEISYDIFVKKKGYNITLVNKLLKENNIDYFIQTNEKKNKTNNSENKNKRGRPRKKEDNDLELVSVREELIDGKIYYITKENIVISVENNKVLGIFKNGIIEYYE